MLLIACAALGWLYLAERGRRVRAEQEVQVLRTRVRHQGGAFLTDMVKRGMLPVRDSRDGADTRPEE